LLFFTAEHYLGGLTMQQIQDFLQIRPYFAETIADLEKTDLDLVICEGDGNCLYRALSWAIYDTEDNYRLLRKHCCKLKSANLELFDLWNGIGETEELIKKQRKNGEWGAADDAIAVAMYHKDGLFIYYPTPNGIKMSFPYEGQEKIFDGFNQIHLINWGTHWEFLKFCVGDADHRSEPCKIFDLAV